MRIGSLLVVSVTLSHAYEAIQGGSGWKDGVHFRYETRVEPRIEGQKIAEFGSGGIVVTESFHRYLIDEATRRYLGYDLKLSKRSDGSTSLALGELSISQVKLGIQGDWHQTPLRVNRTPQRVGPGDEIVVELFANASTGQKIVDHLFFDNLANPVRLPEGPARDFTVHDAPLTLTEPRVLLNGQLTESMGGSISGEAVYVYAPGRGRFALSLAPNAELGFRKLGEVRGSSISFQDGNDDWTLDCKGPVAPGGGVFNLYGVADRGWRPRSGGDSYSLGASSARAMVRR